MANYIKIIKYILRGIIIAALIFCALYAIIHLSIYGVPMPFDKAVICAIGVMIFAIVIGMLIILALTWVFSNTKTKIK